MASFTLLKPHLYRGIDLLQIGDATNIHNTKFDKPSNPIATKGVLDSSMTPVTYIPFVNILNSTQLARFGLHNGTLCHGSARKTMLTSLRGTGDPSDATLIDGKWESIALTSVDDPTFPDDYFLFTAVRLRYSFSSIRVILINVVNIIGGQ